MLSRLSVIRRVARVPTIRYYTDGRSAGSVPQMRGGGIGERGEAEENRYARQHDRDLLKKMRAAIDAKKEELAALEAEHSDLEKKTK